VSVSSRQSQGRALTSLCPAPGSSASAAALRCPRPSHTASPVVSASTHRCITTHQMHLHCVFLVRTRADEAL
jgi:hypothetical protein